MSLFHGQSEPGCFGDALEINSTVLFRGEMAMRKAVFIGSKSLALSGKNIYRNLLNSSLVLMNSDPGFMVLGFRLLYWSKVSQRWLPEVLLTWSQIIFRYLIIFSCVMLCVVSIIIDWLFSIYLAPREFLFLVVEKSLRYDFDIFVNSALESFWNIFSFPAMAASLGLERCDDAMTSRW